MGVRRKIRCKNCLGKGSLPVPFPPHVGDRVVIWMVCWRCEGRGMLFKKEVLSA